MGLGIFYKKVLSFVRQGQLFHELNGASKDHCLILTYHRVLPKGIGSRNIEPGMYVTPKTLSLHLEFLKEYFDIVSMKQAELYLAKPESRYGNKPYCVLTFDDGWIDFYQYAWPVLCKKNVPAVVFLPTGLIGSTKQFWTDRLAKILPVYGMKFLLEKFGLESRNVLNGGSKEQQLSSVIGKLKEISCYKIEKIFDECEVQIDNNDEIFERSFLDWSEIRELSKSGLITFGSHTVNHAILTTLQEKELTEELLSSRRCLLEKEVNCDGLPSFCYPNGNYSKEIVDQVSQSGYSSAVTCDFGWNVGGQSNLMALRRINLHQEVSSNRFLFAFLLVQGM
jgi:peptidoglycan/xylan/chitin deacetylase (PgdA/CDA1 family)